MGNKIKLIIFDFDGVLADSFDTFYPLIRDGMSHVGLSLSPSQYRDFFIGNVHQGFKDFIKNENKHASFLKFRSSNYDKYYYDKRHKAKFFPEVLNFLKKINKTNILTIASSGRQKNVISLLKKNHVRNLFPLVIANGSINKSGMIKKILNKFNKKAEESVMVTDTVGDLKVAKKMGLKTIAVTWGFHSAKILKSEKPDYLVNNFEMLYKSIKAF